MSDIPLIDVGELMRRRDSLSGMRDVISEFVNSYGNAPQTPSKAKTEQSLLADVTFLQVAQCQGTLFNEVTADHLTAFIKTITEPIETVAPWSCVRSMLESAALACWIYDLNIDTATRMKRGFAFRYEGIDQQIKFARSSGEDATKTINRLNEVEGDALRLGFDAVQDRHGKRTGIALNMPSTTSLIHETLDMEAEYRLFSAMAHAHHWAVHKLAFKLSRNSPRFPSDPRMHSLEKQASTINIAALLAVAARAFARPFWNQSEYYGWDSVKLAEIFERHCSVIAVPEKHRFWRPRQ